MLNSCIYLRKKFTKTRFNKGRRVAYVLRTTLCKSSDCCSHSLTWDIDQSKCFKLFIVIDICSCLLTATEIADLWAPKVSRLVTVTVHDLNRIHLSSRWPLILLIKSFLFKYLLCCFYQSLIKQNVKTISNVDQKETISRR